jgi:FSR family fosmidomycin resistance protein-like MFS transporter
MNDKNRLLLTVGLYHAFNDGALVVIPLLFPIFKVLFDLSYTQVGIITGGGLLITLVTHVFIGRISDQKNFRTLLSIGILLLSASMLLITQTQGFLTLLLFIFIVRFSSSFYHPIGIGWVSRTFKKDRIDRGMGIQSALGDLGAFIAILTTLYIAEIKDWTFPFYIWSIIGIAILFYGTYLTHNINKEYITIENNNKIKQTTKEAISEAWEILKRIKLLIPGFIISGAAWGIIVSYLPLLLDERTALPLSTIGVIISIWIGIGVITCFLYEKIQMLLGRRNTLIFGYFTMGIMGLALSIFTNIAILLIIMVFLGISTFITFPAIFSFVSEITHKQVEGKTFGYILTLQLGGGTILLFLSGVLSDICNIGIPFIILGLLSLIIGFLLIGTRNKNVV